MPIGVLIMGLAMLISGINDTQEELSAMLANDLTGDKSFTPWLASIILVGSLGMYKPIRPITDGFMALILVQLLLSSQPSLKSLTEAFKGGLNVVPLDEYRKAKQ